MKSGVQIIFSCKKESEVKKLYSDIKKFLSDRKYNHYTKEELHIEEELTEFHGADCYNTGWTMWTTTVICPPVITMLLYDNVILKRYSKSKYNFLNYKRF